MARTERHFAIASLAVAVIGAAALAHAGGHSASPAGCATAIASAPGHLPRAHLVIENRLSAAMRVWLEPRAGLGLPRTELGLIGPLERRVVLHALPAGRNELTARAAEGERAILRQILQVNNRGTDTCSRRYLWRIE